MLCKGNNACFSSSFFFFLILQKFCEYIAQLTEKTTNNSSKIKLEQHLFLLQYVLYHKGKIKIVKNFMSILINLCNNNLAGYMRASDLD